MSRPRLPSKVLELRGAFARNPSRRREDAPGVGEFAHEPPEYLTGKEKAAWRELIAVLPLIVLTGTDQFAVVQAVRILAALRDLTPLSSDWKRLDNSFRQWLIQLGLTPQARAKIPTAMPPAPASGRSNPFARFHRDR